MRDGYVGRYGYNCVTDVLLGSFLLKTQAETAAIPPAMLVAIITNIQSFVGLCLQEY
jgi:hypothetical protein